MTLDVQFAAPSAFVVEFGTDADLAADLGQTTIYPPRRSTRARPP